MPLALAADDGGRQTDLLATVALSVGCALATRGRPGANGFQAAAKAVVTFAAVYLASRHSTLVWLGLDGLAAMISWAASLLAGTNLHLGPTPSGLWTLLLTLALAIPPRPWSFRQLRARARPLLVYLLAGVGLSIALVAAQPRLEELLKAAAQGIMTPPAYLLGEADQPGNAPPGAMATLAGTFALLAVLLPLGKRLGVFGLTETWPAAALPRQAWAGVLLVAAGAGVLLTPPQARPATGAVAFHDDGFFDFSQPERGRYGLIQAGLYGGLKELLIRSGHTVRTVDSAAVRAGLTDVAVLVFINPKHPLDPETREAVWKFVRAGGGLLVMGDHTDLFGIMAPLNDLLSPVGIRFEFDSAFPLRRHWQNSLEIRPHPITAGLSGSVETQIGTGASLRLSSATARPLILGRYAFGDYGNRLNEGQGGLLGDYRYQLGERLGDLVLVAGAEAGEGRVIALGDTSTFQVLGLPFAHAFIRQLFAYLAHPTPSRIWRMLAGVSLLGAGLALWITRAGRRSSVLPVVAAVIAGEALALLLPRSPLPPLASPGSVAVVDGRLAPGFAFEFFADHSYGGLFTAAQRAGFLPVADRDQGPAMLDGAGMAMFLAPARVPGAEDLAALQRLLARGGTLFVAAGGKELDAANTLLALCGLRIEPIPLGPVQATWKGERLDFFDAWAVMAEEGTTPIVHARSKDFTVVAETSAGGGRCIAIGDHRFLDDQRFEGEKQFHPGNVRFLDALLAGGLKP
ncbi:MAG: hypothetical protein JXB05_03725 [Myxococcaceae bacterium]|nr:hypothetical protein [Myxococcaceae bacterium]